MPVVTTRWLLVAGDRRLRTAYVDAVATRPEFQGQGHGTRVMRQLASGIDDYEIACLETERPTFYTRLGWERWRGPLAVAEASRITPTPEQRGILVLRTGHTPKVDLDTTLTIESLNGRSW
jgi:aminoglycoside 2'-N-acetyltransferase I